MELTKRHKITKKLCNGGDLLFLSYLIFLIGLWFISKEIYLKVTNSPRFNSISLIVMGASQLVVGCASLFFSVEISDLYANDEIFTGRLWKSDRWLPSSRIVKIWGLGFLIFALIFLTFGFMLL